MRYSEVSEAMVWSTPELAAMLPDDHTIILYSANAETREAMNNWEYEKLREAINGIINIQEVTRDYNHVTRVVAKKGFGPLLYYMAMAKWGWLAPYFREEEVTLPAKAVWKKFSEHATIKKIDTANPIHKEDYLNKAYMIDNTTKNKTLNILNNALQMGETFLESASIDKAEAFNLIWEIADAVGREGMQSVYG